MKVNLAKNLKLRLTKIMSEQLEMTQSQITNTLTDDDTYSDWLDFNWSVIKDFDMLVVRDFMTWSYLLDSEASTPIKIEYYFAESE